MIKTQKADDGSRYPISILSCAVPFTASKSKTYSEDIDLRVHPTQKPIRLLEYLIETYSNEGDTVLDNCMGSGSTGVACINTNREFIGMELDENYFKIACERLGA
jgi:site-specific DNA-methyltransferase (adenine-specific)